MSVIKSRLAPHFRLRVPFESGKYGSRWSNKGKEKLSTSDEGYKLRRDMWKWAARALSNRH